MLENHAKVQKVINMLKKVTFFETLARRRQQPARPLLEDHKEDFRTAEKTLELQRRLQNCTENFRTAQGLAGLLPPAGQSFEKLHFLEIFCQFWRIFLCLSSMGLAVVLPRASQIFEKLHFLGNFVNFGEFFVPFKQRSSRGAASGGSDFENGLP